MISEELLEIIRELRKELDNLSQESFEIGLKMLVASKAETCKSVISNTISKSEYQRLKKNPDFNKAAEIVTDSLKLMTELDNLEWVYNDFIQKLYHPRIEMFDAMEDDKDETVYCLEPPFTRSKFLN